MKRSILFFFLALLLAATANAQEAAPTWKIILLERTSTQLITATPNSMETLATIPEYAWFNITFQPQISPDGQYLSFGGVVDIEGTPATGVFLANLTTSQCCWLMPDPIPNGADFVQVGPFNPDSTQISAILARTSAAGEGGPGTAAFITIYNLSDLTIAATLPPAVLQPQGSEGAILSATFGKWKDDGLRVAPACIDCNAPVEGRYQVWNPNTDVLTASQEYFFGANRQILENTGEAIAAVYNENFPSAASDETITPLPNTVEYYAVAGVDAAPEIIYFNPNDLRIRSTGWVLDGNAILVTHLENPMGTLVFRDGTQQTLEIGSDSVLLSGTPDGWLMIDVSRLLHYTFIDNQLVVNTLGPIDGRIVILEQPVLGTTARPGFTTIQ